MRIRRLNYQHLLYFHTVVRTGSIARASAELVLSPPTISAQLRALEERLGEQLLSKRGRRLHPTDVGRMVYEYAEEIFRIGATSSSTCRLLGVPRRHHSQKCSQLLVSTR